jgi:hypothetical protein
LGGRREREGEKYPINSKSSADQEKIKQQGEQITHKKVILNLLCLTRCQIMRKPFVSSINSMHKLSHLLKW